MNAIVVGALVLLAIVIVSVGGWVVFFVWLVEPAPPSRQKCKHPGQVLTPLDATQEYVDSLSGEDRRYRAMYMGMFAEKGCKGYCVAGTGGREPRTGRCPFCMEA